jgi:hypothetical protein
MLPCPFFRALTDVETTTLPGVGPGPAEAVALRQAEEFLPGAIGAG